MNKEHILKILRDVYDPEIPVLTIEDLGIVKDILVHENEVEIIITPTYSGCPAMNTIEKDILNILTKYNIKSKVTTVLSPAWTTDFISEEGRKKLFEYGIAPPAKKSANKKILLGEEHPIVICPQCKSEQTEMISLFGSTACKSLYKCLHCREPFDYFKCL